MANLRLGDKCPNFTADTTLGVIEFHKYIEGKWALLMSHPADFTPVCTTEIGHVASIIDEFNKRNVLPLIVSVDDVASHKEWIKEVNRVKNTNVQFPIIGDEKYKVAELFGMMDPYEKHEGMPMTVRSVFIVGPDKKIKLVLTYPASTGRNFDEIIRAIDSLQITHNRKMATPVNWVKGDRIFLAPSMSAEDAAKFEGMNIVSKSCKIRTIPDFGSPAKVAPKSTPKPKSTPGTLLRLSKLNTSLGGPDKILKFLQNLGKFIGYSLQLRGHTELGANFRRCGSYMSDSRRAFRCLKDVDQWNKLVKLFNNTAGLTPTDAFLQAFSIVAYEGFIFFDHFLTAAKIKFFASDQKLPLFLSCAGWFWACAANVVIALRKIKAISAELAQVKAQKDNTAIKKLESARVEQWFLAVQNGCDAVCAGSYIELDQKIFGRQVVNPGVYGVSGMLSALIAFRTGWKKC